MITNVGVLDAAVRLVLAAGLLAWSYGKLGHAFSPVAVWIAWVAGAGLGLTGLFRYCALYAFFDTNSCALPPGDDRR
jgi:Inner membrane protein YgaP-like, transmembrane domain